METIPTLNPVFCPFAEGDPDKDTIADTGSNIINYATGFPPNFSGSDAVKRDDFNSLGYAMMEERYFRQCGGFHTYRSGQSYPLGAVLYWMDTSQTPQRLHRCLSLVSNNTTAISASELQAGTRWKDVSAPSPVVMMDSGRSGSLTDATTFTAPYPCVFSCVVSSYKYADRSTMWAYWYKITAFVRPRGQVACKVFDFSHIHAGYQPYIQFLVVTGYTQVFKTVLDTGDQFYCTAGTFTGRYTAI